MDILSLSAPPSKDSSSNREARNPCFRCHYLGLWKSCVYIELYLLQGKFLEAWIAQLYHFNYEDAEAREAISPWDIRQVRGWVGTRAQDPWLPHLWPEALRKQKAPLLLLPMVLVQGPGEPYQINLQALCPLVSSGLWASGIHSFCSYFILMSQDWLSLVPQDPVAHWALQSRTEQ